MSLQVFHCQLLGFWSLSSQAFEALVFLLCLETSINSNQSCLEKTELHFAWKIPQKKERKRERGRLWCMALCSAPHTALVNSIRYTAQTPTLCSYTNDLRLSTGHTTTLSSMICMYVGFFFFSESPRWRGPTWLEIETERERKADAICLFLSFSLSFFLSFFGFVSMNERVSEWAASAFGSGSDFRIKKEEEENEKSRSGGAAQWRRVWVFPSLSLSSKNEMSDELVFVSSLKHGTVAIPVAAAYWGAQRTCLHLFGL